MLPRIGFPVLEGIVPAFLFRGEQGIDPHQFIQHPPVFWIAPGDKTDVLPFRFHRSVQVEDCTLLASQGVHAVLDEPAEKRRDRFGPLPGKAFIVTPFSLRGAGGGNGDGIHLEHLVFNQ